MQNDVLKNTIAPWQEKGRWYHGFVVSSGSAWSIDTVNSDPIFSNFSIYSTSYLDVGDYSNMIYDVKCTVSGTVATAFNYGQQLTIRYGSSHMFVALPSPSAITGTIELWIFIEH